MVVVESRKNDKLRDLVPNGEQRARMELCDGSVISIVYLSDAEKIKLYLKAAGVDKQQFDSVLYNVDMISNSPNGCIKGIYYLVAMHMGAEGLFAPMTQRRPDCYDDFKSDGLLFEENLKRSGLWKCELLSVFVKEQHVFVLDIFASVSLKDLIM